jgi:hypothetical protein
LGDWVPGLPNDRPADDRGRLGPDLTVSQVMTPLEWLGIVMARSDT